MTQPEPGRVDTEGPLDGLVVADFSRVLAGPLASMMLGDLGADVVKVERPGVGDDTRSWGPPWRNGESTYSLAINRNKRSVELDLSDHDDRVLARRLAERADVLIENFRPGTPERFGLDYETLRLANPGLVYASISGFGQAPQAKELGAYDFVVQAVSGLMSITGQPGGEPQKVGVAVVDVAAGLYTTIGVLAALAERTKSREGQVVQVSLLGSGLASLVNQASAFIAGDVVPDRSGDPHPSIAPYEVLKTADRPIVVAVGSDRLFRIMAEVLGREDLVNESRFVTNATRVANRFALHDELESVLANEPSSVWVRRLRERGVPAGTVNDISEAFAEATELGLRPIITSVRDDGESVPTVRSPIDLGRTPIVTRRASPLLGQHNAEIRRWLETDES